jgi:hypothetical protein
MPRRAAHSDGFTAADDARGSGEVQAGAERGSARQEPRDARARRGYPRRVFTPSSARVVGRLSAAGGAGFVLSHLLALSMRDHDFSPSPGSAAMEHLGAWFFVLFALSFPTALKSWESAGGESGDTPGTDGARIALVLLAVVLLASSATSIAALRSDVWRPLADTLDTACLLPLVALVPLLTVAMLPPGASTGYAIAGYVVAVGGLCRAAAFLVDKDDNSMFRRGGITGGLAFALFAVWIAVGAFLAARAKNA